MKLGKRIELVLDTKDRRVTVVSLKIGNRIYEEHAATSTGTSAVVLLMISDLLKMQNCTLWEIDDVLVSEGPGSFTGLRVGIAIANTLGILLWVPVNGKPPGSSVTPQYTI